MSDEILKLLLEKLEKVEHKVVNSPAMNGGFDKLLSEVDHIKQAQTEILDSVRGIKQSLYAPDSGLYSRIKQLETESKSRLQYVKDSKPALEFAKELQVWKVRADKDLEEVERLHLEVSKLQDWRDGMQKVIWLLATAAGGLWVKNLADLMMR